MNIRDLAKEANVSPATVSKVLNRRDVSVSAETRERILRLAKEHNYVPTSPRSARQPTRLLGVLLRSGLSSGLLLQGVIDAAREEGYSPLVCTYGDAQEEQKMLRMLESHHVDGVVWEHGAHGDTAWRQYRGATPVAHLAAEPVNVKHTLYFDWTDCGFNAAQQMISRNHTHILCALDADSLQGDCFYTGYQRAMQQAGLHVEGALRVTRVGEISTAQLFECTAAVCQNRRTARRVYDQLQSMNLHVPQDVSILCLQADGVQPMEPPISALPLQYRSLGANAAHRLIARIEEHSAPAQLPLLGELTDTATLSEPASERSLRVVVVGELNIDMLINLPQLPNAGETRAIISRTRMPGGKGLNQAVGCHRLGADVTLIGTVGRDYEGSLIYNFLQNNGISTAHVTTDASRETGFAYIAVQGDGESSVIIDRGANACLTAELLEKQEALFAGAGFCLLQTELSPELALCAARMARRHGVKVILKPCNQPRLSDELLQCVDYLIPNKLELQEICPDGDTMEDKVRILQSRGADTVIVTLSAEGCMLAQREQAPVYFPAAAVRTVDTTGACDAFAAALAVYCMRGESLHTALELANCAAGLSTERQGVPPALPDDLTVRQFYQTHPFAAK